MESKRTELIPFHFKYTMEYLLQLTSQNIENEHICCAFSDKKCSEGYLLKKRWLQKEFCKDYTFVRLDARAKVFIEYGPAEMGWMPVVAPGYLLLGCFWVSGQYKGKGYAKKLLQHAIDAAKAQGKSGLVAVVGKRKFPFMGDGKWLLRQGFEACDTLDSGFELLTLKIDKDASSPRFAPSAIKGTPTTNNGFVAYYSNRCPFTEYHVNTSLVEAAQKRAIPLTIVKLETMEQAQMAPSPATIFSLYHNGKFIATDISICLDSRMDKMLKG